jgi:large conductance mechanosensitive channel
MLGAFKAFIMRGNVMDLAIAIVIGVAFGAIVVSFVNDVLMPPIGLLVGGVDFSNLFAVLRPGTLPGPYATLAAAQDAGAVTLNYGRFINTIFNFLIVSGAVFLVVLLMQRLKLSPATTKSCPFCLTAIPTGATRCAACTSEQPPAAP